jgi:uncharacterized protein (DUF362 family)
MIDSASGFNRRDFVRTISTGLAALPVLGRNGLAQVLTPARSRVMLVRTTDRRRGVAELFTMLNPQGIGGKSVVIKPNFNTADETPGSTHNDTLAQIVSELHERNARAVTLGESSGPGTTRDIMAKKGIFDLGRERRFDIVNFDENTDKDWVSLPAAGTHWPDGFALARLIVDSEYTVTTGCLKTHGPLGVYTMSMKLAVGMTPKPIRRTMHASPDGRRMIAELNTGYKPNLIILDGVATFTNGGPGQGELKMGNVMLGAVDRVAADAVGVAVLKSLGANEAIMSRGIFQQEQIARAVELKLGVTSPDQIEIVTADAESRAYADTLRSILARG